MKLILAAVLSITAGIAVARSFNRPATTCQWPNTCGALALPELQQTNAVAQFQPCVWPNRCVTAM